MGVQCFDAQNCHNQSLRRDSYNMMMKYLFMNNYRGFSNAVVPLIDVNFLVGENSSGKTSVLSLLKILSAPSLFMGSMFGGGDEVLFGHFNEAVSAHSPDRSFFSVGMVEERPFPDREDDRPKTTGILLTFRDQSGVPKISRLTVGVGKHSLSLNITDDKLFYRENAVVNSSAKLISAEDMKESLQQWSLS